MKYGKLISIEGVEGVGKSTVISSITRWAENILDRFLVTREPGGTEISEKIRNVLIDHHEKPLCDQAELLLMFASRAQLFQEVIAPALSKGTWVITDRFVDASYAYQGAGRGFKVDEIKSLHDISIGGHVPDLTFLLDLPIEISRSRISHRELDRIELEKDEFFHRVRQGYLSMAKNNPERFCLIDATLTKEAVHQKVIERLESFF